MPKSKIFERCILWSTPAGQQVQQFGTQKVATKKEQSLDDIQFIFAEVARIDDIIAKSGLKSVSRDDMWFTIPHPNSGDMLCGRAAAKRIEGLAQIAGQRAKLLRRVERSVLEKDVAEVLVERFVRQNREISVKEFDRAMNDVARRSKARCVDLTHFIPCHLMHATDPDELRLGPIVFRNRAAFQKILREKVRGHDHGPDQQKYSRHLLAGAVRYYRSFQWVAEVTIKGCDTKTSEKLAERAVISGLDCLHLVLGARWTNRMRVGGPAIRSDRRGYLSVNPTGTLNVSTSSSAIGQINFSNGWSDSLITDDRKDLLALCSVALEVTVDPDLLRPISRRFLDAAQWFGEGARDISPSTSVVKYVMALERMVMTEEKDDITSLLSDRIASLCFDQSHPEDWDDWKQRAAEIYRLRSKLVHGSMSPLDERSLLNLKTVAETTEVVLLNMLTALGENVIRLEDGNSRRLAKWFQRLVDFAAILVEHHKSEAALQVDGQIA